MNQGGVKKALLERWELGELERKVRFRQRQSGEKERASRQKEEPGRWFEWGSKKTGDLTDQTCETGALVLWERTGEELEKLTGAGVQRAGLLFNREVE